MLLMTQQISSRQSGRANEAAVLDDRIEGADGDGGPPWSTSGNRTAHRASQLRGLTPGRIHLQIEDSGGGIE